MKRKLLTLLLLMSAVVFAAETGYVQFTDVTIHEYSRADQNWLAANMASVTVKGGTTVYLTNYISNWYYVPNLGDSSYAAGFDMSPKKYGYLIADGEGNLVTSDVIWAQGIEKDIYIQNPSGNPLGITTKGYLLDTFDEDTEIFLVMTPNGYDTPVSSYEYVQDSTHPTELVSREYGTHDILGSVRVNFSMSDTLGHEFTVGYEAATHSTTPTGQPLPGVLTSCLIGLCATGIAARRRKQSRK